jgi:hypothetical protein
VFIRERGIEGLAGRLLPGPEDVEGLLRSNLAEVQGIKVGAGRAAKIAWLLLGLGANSQGDLPAIFSGSVQGKAHVYNIA